MKIKFAALSVTAAVLAGCGGGGSEEADQSAETITAHVLVELRYPFIAEALDSVDSAPEQCAGGSDYSRIRTGSAVTIRDADGKAVGSTEFSPALPGDNLVICTWSATVEVKSDSKFFTAEVGGWTSAAQAVKGTDVRFALDTVKEDPEFGSEAEIDPNWTTR